MQPWVQAHTGGVCGQNEVRMLKALECQVPGRGRVRQGVGIWEGDALSPALSLLLTVEELRLDMEELLLSMRSSEGPGPRVSSPFSRISDAAWAWGGEK